MLAQHVCCIGSRVRGFYAATARQEIVSIFIIFIFYSLAIEKNVSHTCWVAAAAAAAMTTIVAFPCQQKSQENAQPQSDECEWHAMRQWPPKICTSYPCCIVLQRRRKGRRKGKERNENVCHCQTKRQFDMKRAI